MSKTIKKVASIAAPIVGNFIAPGIGGVIGGAIGGAASGGGLKGALLGGLGAFAGNALSVAGGAGGGLSNLGSKSLTSGLGTGLSATNLSAGLGNAVTSSGAGANIGSGLFSGGLGGAGLGPMAAGATPGIVPAVASGGGSLLSQLGVTPTQALKGGLNVLQNLQNESQLQKIAQQQATMADPFQAQRGQAITNAQMYAQDPTANPLYAQSLAEAERALARRQAASGGYFSGGALAQSAQLPAEVLAQLQQQSVGQQGQVAQAAGGAPGTAASLYGNSATGAAAAGAAAPGSFFEPAEREKARNQSLAMLGAY